MSDRNIVENTFASLTNVPHAGSFGYSPYENANVFDGLGNFFTGNLDHQRQMDIVSREMAFNAVEAQKQRDYNYMMDTTQYQRAVDDLRKAGLNPYLAYQNGGNSTTATTPASIGSHSAQKSGQGFSTLLGFFSRLLGGMMSTSNAMMNANNAMQIANMRNIMDEKYYKMYLGDRNVKSFSVKGFVD